ncbi:MAG: hypothetical protein ACI37S_08305 [Candidatus Gastranaerophilaceae bacterium]
MKHKLLRLFTILFVIFAMTNIAFAAVLKTNAITKRIPAGTKFTIQLLEPISTKNNKQGDFFSAMLVDDEKTSTSVILPAGSMIRGSISKIVTRKRFSKGAVLYLDFDHIVTPNGRQLPLEMIISGKVNMNFDGGVYYNKGYGEAIQKNWDKTVDITSNATDYGMDIGEVGPFNILRVATVPVCAIGGAIGGGAYFLGDSVIDMFRKGQDVEFNQGETLTVILTQPIDVPIN